MPVCNKLNPFLGFFAGGLLSIFGKKPVKSGVDDLKRLEFKSSAQQMGVRFTEKVRDIFRFRWIKRR